MNLMGCVTAECRETTRKKGDGVLPYSAVRWYQSTHKQAPNKWTVVEDTATPLVLGNRCTFKVQAVRWLGEVGDILLPTWTPPDLSRPSCTVPAIRISLPTCVARKSSLLRVWETIGSVKQFHMQAVVSVLYSHFVGRKTTTT